MKNIKYTIDEVVKRPLIFFIIVVQVIFCSMILVQTLNDLFQLKDTYIMAKNTFDMKSVYRLMKDSNYVQDENVNSLEYKKKDNELYNYLVNNEKFKYCIQVESNIIIKDFCDKDNFCYSIENKYINNPYDNINGKYSNVKGLYVDKNYIDTFCLNIEKGRIFEDNEFESYENIPIILGANYKGIYNIGDEFKFFDYFTKCERKLKVIGFLKRNSYHYLNGFLSSLDDYVICPFIKIKDVDEDSDKYNAALGQAILVSDNISEDFNEIRDKAIGLGVNNYSIFSATSDIEKVINNLEAGVRSALFKSILMILFIALGIIAVKYNQIISNLKLYGIHLLLGASKKDIIIRNLYSVLAYFVIGASIGVYFEYFRKCDLTGYSYDYRILIGIVLIYLMVVIVIFYMLYKKISKMEVNQIMRKVSNE